MKTFSLSLILIKRLSLASLVHSMIFILNENIMNPIFRVENTKQIETHEMT